MGLPNHKTVFILRHIFLFFIATLALFGGFHIVFKKPYKATVISNLEDRKLGDVVVRFYQYKDDSGPQVATLFKGNDTAFCFTGFEEKTRLWYPNFVRSGDSLIKEPKAKTFYIKRNGVITTFDLFTCSSYLDSDPLINKDR